jgi:hypothetical protein
MLQLEDFYPEITDRGIQDLYKLAEIVLNSHFSYVSRSDREELVSAGIVKALSFIKESAYDPSRSSLKNVLYTAMRNEMKNTLYRSSRELLVEDDILIGANEAPPVSIDFPLLTITSDSFLGIRPSLVLKIKSSLNYLGFVTDSSESIYYPEVERWITLVLWRKLK